jgi:hypothetical protein
MSSSTRFLTVVAVIAGAACTAEAPITTAESSAALHSAHSSALHKRSASDPADFTKQLAELRRVTAPYHNIDTAIAAGYAVQVTPCWEHRTQGAMGYHYGMVDPSEWDVSVNLLEPELLMYEPGPGGHMRLVGMEYVVPKAAWDLVSPDAPPMLLGEEFHEHSFLPIYKFHIWLWRINPQGIFADWNPEVSCEFAAEADYFE